MNDANPKELLPANESFVPSIDFAYLYHLLLSKSWLIILFVVVSLFAAMAYLMRTPKIYSSRAVIQVEQEAQKVVNIQEINPEDFKTLEVLKTIEQSLTSQTLLLRVLKANKLDEDPAFAKPKKDGSPYAESELVDLFMPKLSAKLRRGTRLIDVSIEDPDPKRARDLTQSMIKEFVGQNFDQKLSVSKIANDFLIQEAEGLKAKLQTSEQALQQYREIHNAVSLEEKQDITLEKLKELNLKVTEAKNERLKLETDVATIQQAKARTPEDMLLLASVTALPEVAAMRKQVSDQEAEYDVTKERYMELHPKYIQAEGHIKELKQALNRALLKAGDLVMKSYESARATEAKLAAALKDQEQLALELNKIAIPYNVLTREVQSDRALYESVLKRMKETNVTQGLEKNNIRIIEVPLVAAKPIKPRKAMILALALFGGLMAGGGVVFGLDIADNSIRSVDQAEDMLGLPVLSSIPESHRKDRETHAALTSDPACHEAEAFRSLRTAVSFLGPEDERKTILFTSANPAEGKSYCSFNYAVALAQQGLRTLIIDADLRRPSLSEMLLEDRNVPGLTACLVGHATIMDSYKPTSVENLFVLGAGGRAPKPAELLASGKFAGLLQEVSPHFDRIVIDSAPVNAVSDTLLIVKDVHSISLVVRAGKTPRRAITRACHLLAIAGGNPDGAVLNRMTRCCGAGYYAYYYDGGYAKAGAYGTGESALKQ